MIRISKATKSQIKTFNIKDWHGVDVEHYGKPIEWNEKPFLYKAVNDGKIVGTISGKHESGVVYVGTLIVAANERGRGIGKLLMQKAEEFGKNENAHKVYLTTGKEWKASKFYESLGYKKEANLSNHHFHKDFVIYSKLIS